jgi:hypothetical protein
LARDDSLGTGRLHNPILETNGDGTYTHADFLAEGPDDARPLLVAELTDSDLVIVDGLVASVEIAAPVRRGRDSARGSPASAEGSARVLHAGYVGHGQAARFAARFGLRKRGNIVITTCCPK